MRGLLSSLLVLVALAAALVVQTMGYVGRDVLQADRFADTTVRALAAPGARGEVAATLTGALRDDLARRGVTAAPALVARVDLAVRAAVAGPEFRAAVLPAVAATHRSVLDDPSRGVRVDLAVLRPAVVAAVERVQPGFGGAVPAAEAFPVIAVPLAAGARAAVEAGRRLRDGWTAVGLLGAAAFLGALALARNRRAVLRGAGTGLLLLALAPVAVRLVAPLAARATAPSGTRDLAAAFTEALVDGWLTAAAWTAAGGLALVVAGALPVGRR